VNSNARAGPPSARVTATDAESWSKFRRYFALVGPASHFIRRSILSSLVRRHGTPESREAERALPGDELLPDAAGQVTNGVTIAASPQAIWPWLLQMGGQRACFYSIDILDNGGVRSARELHPELQQISVGDVIAATPRGGDGFEVLVIEPDRALRSRRAVACMLHGFDRSITSCKRAATAPRGAGRGARSNPVGSSWCMRQPMRGRAPRAGRGPR
jgi:hypothetical protein